MRIKRGLAKHQKHKKILNLASGYRMSYSKLYRRALEAVKHAGQYSLNHRRRRKSQMREQWIKTISAALIPYELSYSQFINRLKTNKIILDRKSLSEMILRNPEHFKQVAEAVK